MRMQCLNLRSASYLGSRLTEIHQQTNLEALSVCICVYLWLQCVFGTTSSHWSPGNTPAIDRNDRAGDAWRPWRAYAVMHLWQSLAVQKPDLSHR